MDFMSELSTQKEKSQIIKKIIFAFATLLQNSIYICATQLLLIMKITKLIPFAALVAFSLVFTSCDKDDPEIPVEEELITTVNFTLSPVDGISVVMTFVDLDGDGAGEAVISGGTLAANQIYSGSIELLNEAESPSEDVTEEIAEEDEEHQFFFSTTVSGLEVTYADQDEDGNPIGLSTSVTTGTAGTGNLTITLRHEPVKDASGVAGGDITNAQGETDIEVTFPIVVQ